MTVTSDLEGIFEYSTGTSADWAVPCYYTTVDSTPDPTELYVWFRLDVNYDRIYAVADVYILHKNNVLQTLGGGLKALGRDEEGDWREKVRLFKYSSEIELLMRRVIKGEVFPISKIILMTHPVEDLREIFKLSLEAAIKGAPRGLLE